jgi:hypothetical protein
MCKCGYDSSELGDAPDQPRFPPYHLVTKPPQLDMLEAGCNSFRALIVSLAGA